MGFRNIVSREVDPAEMAVVTVGSVQAGATENVIADHAVLKVNIRTVNPRTREKVLTSVRKIIKAECEASGSPKEALIEATSRFPLTTNDDNVAKRLTMSFSEFFKENFDPNTPAINGSEDVSILASSVGKPYNFWFFGGVDREQWDRAQEEGNSDEAIAVNHSGHFAPVIQPTLRTGYEALCVAALTFLKGN